MFHHHFLNMTHSIYRLTGLAGQFWQIESAFSLQKEQQGINREADSDIRRKNCETAFVNMLI